MIKPENGRLSNSLLGVEVGDIKAINSPLLTCATRSAAGWS
jgi:hypothetical protein